jgi:sigma-B regulation protein RsbU (phosphoserine phosphatase)
MISKAYRAALGLFQTQILHFLHQILMINLENNLKGIPDISATATVLGLFGEWECFVAEVQLAASDTLVLYTDGVTEAVNTQDVQFGESRLVETMLAQRQPPVCALLETIVETVQKFSEGEQADDITLVVARRRS